MNYNQRFFIGALKIKASSFEKVRTTQSAILVYAKSVRKRRKKKSYFLQKQNRVTPLPEFCSSRYGENGRSIFMGIKKISLKAVRNAFSL